MGNPPTIRVLSLCTGGGGLDLAIRLVLSTSRVVCYVEREAFCCEHLAKAMEAGIMDPAPVWADLTTFDGSMWRGSVDLVVSGLPCQPYSAAGKRRGDDDERALWPEFVRIVRECQPAAVFLENVPRFLKFFEPVWRELRGMGFEFAPPLFHTAHEAGATHRRKRLFVFGAHTECQGLPPWQGILSDDEQECTPLERVHRERALVDRVYALSCQLRVQPGRCRWPGWEEATELGAAGDERANADSSGQPSEWSGWVLDRKRQTLRHDIDRCGVRCRICGTQWATESPVRRVVNGLAPRVDLLRMLGNGVVPVVGAMAFLHLTKTLGGLVKA